VVVPLETGSIQVIFVRSQLVIVLADYKFIFLLQSYGSETNGDNIMGIIPLLWYIPLV
jgi:hypothetical protein